MINYNNKTWSQQRVVGVSPVVSIAQAFARVHWGLSSVLLAIVMSALCVIFVTNESRVMSSQLQSAQNANTQSQILQSKLVLEKTALTSQSYVEQVAQKKLGLVLANNQNTVTV